MGEASFPPDCNSICPSVCARNGMNGWGQGLHHRLIQIILLLESCSVIHLRCSTLICSSPPYMSTPPMQPWKNTPTPRHTHTHTPTLVILDQPQCSFGQSSGCPSSPITVATELHPDSLQIGYVTLNTGAPTHSDTIFTLVQIHL